MENTVKMQPLVSVIVCLYNAKGTLPRCLDSILAQSLKDIEIIIVDDGSTDGSAQLTDRYAAADSRIVVIHQSNQGIAAARQCGIDKARGIYTIHVDADDWVEPDMLEALTDCALNSGAGMVFCDFMEENEAGVFYRRQQPCSEESSKVLQQMLVKLHGCLWNKLIRRDLYTLSGASFVKGLNFCEDESIVIRLLSFGCKVGYVERAFYHYDKNSNAASYTNLWDRRTPDEYELFIQSCKPSLNDPQCRKNLDTRIAGIIKKLTYAPESLYASCKEFYLRHRDSLKRSDMSFSRKLYCWLYYNGFPLVKKFGRANNGI